MSTFKSCACLREQLKVECNFWHRGLSSIASPSLKLSLRLSAEVVVKGLTVHVKPGLVERYK